MVKKILHLEGLILFLAALFFYHQLHGNWLLFVLLLLVPDVSMVGYLKDKKLGSITYNLVHNYILPVALIALGSLLPNQILTLLGTILFAHVSMDRFFGFGLKYPTNFKDTHMQKV